MNDADKLLAIAEKDRRVAQATLDDEEWVAEDVIGILSDLELVIELYPPRLPTHVVSTEETFR